MPRLRRVSPAESAAERHRRLTLLLSTWFELWDAPRAPWNVSAACVLQSAASPGTADHLTGVPFTETSSAVLILNPSRVSGRVVHPVHSPRRASAVFVLRRAAAAWGGSYRVRSGCLTGCNLGLPREEWRRHVC